MIEQCHLYFNGTITSQIPYYIAPCCVKVNPPAIGFGDTPDDTIRLFMLILEAIKKESKALSRLSKQEADEQRVYTKPCADCKRFVLGDWNIHDGLIHYVNISPYPSPCNSKCTYCNFYSCGGTIPFAKDEFRTHPVISASYEKMFDAIKHALDNGMIAKNAPWQVSCGEIAIHPYKEEIYELTRGKDTTYLTNCFIFDMAIADELSKNPNVRISFSIDAGTAQTWHKIKGVDNFNTVKTNLTKYCAFCQTPEQIMLKYIVLPGVNDDAADYLPAIEIMKSLSLKRLEVSRNFNAPYKDEADRDNTMRSVARLVAMLNANDIAASLHHSFSAADREKIDMYTTEFNQ